MASDNGTGDDEDGGEPDTTPSIPTAVSSEAPRELPPGVTLDRRVTPEGLEIALIQRGDVFEIICDGQFLMASDCRRSEESLAELTLAPLSQRNDITVLVAGLGMAHTLSAVLRAPGVQRVDVVEFSDAVIEWNRDLFASLPGHAEALADPRVRIHQADLLGFLKKHRYGQLDEVEGLPTVKDGWLALMLDVDNGPRWLSRPQNEPLYTEEGLSRIEAALRPGGVLGVWSADRDLEFYRRIHARFVNAAELAVPVEVRGHASFDYVYRGRRPPDRSGGASKIAQA